MIKRKRTIIKQKRTIILHYHLFKNAGSSLDKILQKNFNSKFLTKEFSKAKNKDTTEEVCNWIKENPDNIVFSTHSSFPLPVLDNVNIISVCFLRDPIDRIKSAYKFERKQNVNNFSANLAKNVDFNEYVRVLQKKYGEGSQCRNFQTHKLSQIVPIHDNTFTNAIEALSRITFVGLVEEFDKSMKVLSNKLKNHFPDFVYEYNHSNKSSSIPIEIPQYLNQILVESNRYDLELLKTFYRSINLEFEYIFDLSEIINF